MTDYRATQVSLEQWASGTPALNATQLVLEEWGTVTAVTVRMTVSQVSLEQWASVGSAATAGPRVSLIV